MLGAGRVKHCPIQFLRCQHVLIPQPRHIPLLTTQFIGKVQEPEKLIQLIEQLELPELCFEERLGITLQLRELFGVVQELEPTMAFA